MLATVAAADSASTVKKKYSVFIYSEAEPHAMYAIYKQTLTLCVIQYFISSKVAANGCSGGKMGLSREHPKELFVHMFYSWWNCPLSFEHLPAPAAIGRNR